MNRILPVLLTSIALVGLTLTGAWLEVEKERAALQIELGRADAERASLSQTLTSAISAGRALGEATERVAGEAATTRDALAQTEAEREALAGALVETAARLQAREDASGALATTRAAYEEMTHRWEDALAGRFGTLASIHNGNVTWGFSDTRGQLHKWRFDLDEYKKYALVERPVESIYMKTTDGTDIRVIDPRPYVTADVFAPYVGSLSEGRTDREFVRDAFHVKGQFVVYDFSLIHDAEGRYLYPVETLVEGRGICGDTTILLASLLAAGDAREDYGYTVRLWIVLWEDGRLVEDPQRVNHALLEVEFADGESWFLETTSRAFYTHDQVHGWSYPIEGGASKAGLPTSAS